ncbi:MAG: aminopeptidase [Anaerolineales bacterium]|nr:aminopeptidase [Anaerolineales bacterium]
MSDPRLKTLARLLVSYCVRAQPGDRVALRCLGSIATALHLQAEVMHQILHAGAHPHLWFTPDQSEEFDAAFYSEANDAQLEHIDPLGEHLCREFECDIVALCETNPRRLDGIDASRQCLHRRSLSDLRRVYFQRAGRGDLRWVLVGLPTIGYADNAGMSLPEYENFVYSATFADVDDPISAWQSVSRGQQHIVDWLAGKRQVQLKGPHVDLTFSIAGRSFINCDGHLNMPDGEVFTGPVEDSVNGWVESTFPAINYGIDVGRVTLRLENGLVVRADAEKNPEQFIRLLDTDAGARRLGEFGIGTNERIQTFTQNMLFDEKIGGTVHVAVGSSYPETGAVNESAVHWDFLCDMKAGGQIIVDGQLVYDSGRFLI